MVLALIIGPLSARAGILTALSGMLNMGSDSPAVGNSQNMALLEAAINNDPNPNKDTVPTQIEADSALLADAGPEGTIADLASTTYATDQVNTYTVRAGDTLSEIADMFDVSVNTILWANNLKKGAALKEGQTLLILPVSGVQHQVKKGDTLAGIAKKYGGDPAEILAYNGLDAGSSLPVGQTIIIPNGEVGTSEPTKQKTIVVTGNKKKVIYSNYGSASVGYYRWPVLGGMLTQGLHGHYGVDIAAPIGTPIVAAADGIVILARETGWNGGYGRYLVLKHPNGTQTFYAHTSELDAYVGEHVSKGQIIAKIGSTGNSTGPHCHFEVRGARNPFGSLAVGTRG